MANHKTIELNLEALVVPLLKEILEKLKCQEENSTKIVELAAAKIISEIKKCPCNEEIIEAIRTKFDSQKDDQIIPRRDEGESSSRLLYSYPNNSIGNIELGTGKNPNSLSWPFGLKEKD